MSAESHIGSRPPLWQRALGTIAVRGIGAAAAFGLALAIARLLGGAEAGSFYLATSVAMIAASVGQLGLGGAAMRVVAAREDSASADAAGSLALRLAMGASAVVSIALLAAAPLVADVFGDALATSHARWAAAAVTPISAVYVRAQALIGDDRQLAAAALLNLSPPLAAFAAALALGPSTADGALAIWTIAYAAIGLVAGRAGLRSATGADLSVRDLLRRSLPLLVVSLGLIVMTWTDTIILGLSEGREDVGVYNSARQLALVLSLVLLGVSSIVAPAFARHHENGERSALAREARRAASTALAVGAIPALVLLVASGWVLEVAFGSEFRDGVAALRILTVGQLVNLAAGAVGYVLIMTGNERRHSYAQMAAAGLNLVLDLALVPRWGMAGAATATAASLAVFNLLSLRWAREELGAWTVGWSRRDR